MAVVRQFDKRSGITYVFDCVCFRDKVTKKPRSTRTLIGRLDTVTGEVVPTDGRMKRAKEKKESAEFESAKPVQCIRQYFGATYLLDKIGDKLGITDDLKKCLGDDYKKFLSIVYYTILEDKSPLYRFEKWNVTHRHPYGKDIPSQRSSDLLMSISQRQIDHFCQLQGKHRQDNEYLLFDTTSISSYSEMLKQAQYGHNKENAPIPQFNLSLVFGEKSQLPFGYRKLAGNIPDVKTLKNLLTELDFLGHKKPKLVTDKGFFSKENIEDMFKERVKFLLSAKTSVKLITEQLKNVYSEIQQLQYYNNSYQLYSKTIPAIWEIGSQKKSKSSASHKKHRVYVHVYYDIMRMAEKQNKLDKHITVLKEELQSNKRKPSHEKQYEKYFTVKKRKKGNIVTIKEDVVKEEKQYYGFFVLLSSEKMDSITALELYRNKDIIEKAFGNLKDRLNLRRTMVSSESGLDGKLFVGFVGLIYLAYIKRQMQEKGLFKTYTISELLDKIDLIECFKYPDRKLQIGEILEKQKQIFIDLDVKLPLYL